MFILKWLKERCRCGKRKDEKATFLISCSVGDLNAIINITKNYTLDSNIIMAGIERAVDNGFPEIVRHLFNLIPFSEERTNLLNSSMKKACLNNNYNLAETMVQLGALIVVGLRYSKSPNITKMLYRYEQNSEIINY